MCLFFTIACKPNPVVFMQSWEDVVRGVSPEPGSSLDVLFKAMEILVTRTRDDDKTVQVWYINEITIEDECFISGHCTEGESQL